MAIWFIVANVRDVYKSPFKIRAAFTEEGKPDPLVYMNTNSLTINFGIAENYQFYKIFYEDWPCPSTRNLYEFTLRRILETETLYLRLHLFRNPALIMCRDSIFSTLHRWVGWRIYSCINRFTFLWQWYNSSKWICTHRSFAGGTGDDMPVQTIELSDEKLERFKWLHIIVCDSNVERICS